MKFTLSKVIALCLLVSFAPASLVSPASAQTPSLVSGTLKTLDGKAIPKMLVSISELRGTQIGDTTRAETDSQGRFFFQVPIGEYAVRVNEGSSSTSRCLTTSFRYNVSEARQSLEIKTPSFETYRIRFTGQGSNGLVANVTPYLRFVQFESVDNGNLGQLEFFCSSKFFTAQPEFRWETFKIAQIQEEPERARFWYVNGLRQRIDTNMPNDWWKSTDVRVELPSTPTVRIKKSSVKFKDGFVVGVAKFTEHPSMVELNFKRNFRVSFKETSKDNLSIWRSLRTTSKIDRQGNVSFRAPLRKRGNSKFEVILRGANFAVASNVVSLRISNR